VFVIFLCDLVGPAGQAFHVPFAADIFKADLAWKIADKDFCASFKIHPALDGKAPKICVEAVRHNLVLVVLNGRVQVATNCTRLPPGYVVHRRVHPQLRKLDRLCLTGAEGSENFTQQAQAIRARLIAEESSVDKPKNTANTAKELDCPNLKSHFPMSQPADQHAIRTAIPVHDHHMRPDSLASVPQANCEEIWIRFPAIAPGQPRVPNLFEFGRRLQNSKARVTVDAAPDTFHLCFIQQEIGLRRAKDTEG